MNLHEYQSKEVFREFGIPVPSGRAARSAEEAVAAAKELGGDLWVVKAQVHAGGRGKAGGVKLARDLDAVRVATANMLGQRLVTKQTGPEGLPIETVYVESGSQIEREIYLSLTLNRERGRVAVIASAAGGMDIEEVAEHEPEKILRVDINPAAGLQPYQCRKLAFGLGFKGPQVGQFQTILMALYRIYLRARCLVARGQPAHRHQGGRPRGARRQDQHRRQRHVPAESIGGPARPIAGRPHRARGQRTRPQLRLAGRRYRLHGEWRRPGHGHHGPHQAAWRQSRELPRRGRRRHGRARHRGLQADPVQQEGARDPGQHLRRHRALRPDRRGRDDRGQAGGCEPCPWWCGWRERTRTWRAKCSRTARSPSPPPPISPTRPARSSRSPQARRKQ